MFKTAAIFFGGYSHTAYHPFDDIAVMAKQSSWLAAVMAMIGAYLLAFKGALTYGALTVLFIHQAIYRGAIHAGAALSLLVKNGVPSSGIVAILGVCLRAVALVLCATLLLGLWRGGLGGTSGLDFWQTVALTSLGSYLLAVCVIMSIGVGKVFSPLGRRTLGLPFTFHSSPLALDARVV